MLIIRDLKAPLDYEADSLKNMVSEKLNISPDRIKHINIIKRAVNNRNIQEVFFDITVSAVVTGDEDEVLSANRKNSVFRLEEPIYSIPRKKLSLRPVVVGCGPAGLFAALLLARAGANPVLLERGADVYTRTKKVERFWDTGQIDTETNVQFGEGGAGLFSDGKLKTGKKDGRKEWILNELIKAGAPFEIRYLAKPHIGTDNLKKVVVRIRNEIISMGGEVRFGVVFSGLIQEQGKIKGIRLRVNGQEEEVITDNVVLAIGNSARDTFYMLKNSGIAMEYKPFAVGIRIEHPQELINRIKYGGFSAHPSLGAADYRMAVHLPNGRNVYTFCMCPGGRVVAASSEEEGLTVNGMSEFARDGQNANTALLVTLKREDMGSGDTLAGIEYQRRIERAAFVSGGGGYKAPVQRLEDFMQRRSSDFFGDVQPTYIPGTRFAQADSYLPDYITDSLRRAVKEMEDWMPGFAFPDALLTGAETRSSSPVRILRDEGMQAVGLKGLYPCGEGAGYSGGIISAAVDGVLCAEHILKK